MQLNLNQLKHLTFTEMAINNTLWVEKYRPDILENYVGNENLKETISKYIEQNDIQNLIFYGQDWNITTLKKLKILTGLLKFSTKNLQWISILSVIGFLKPINIKIPEILNKHDLYSDSKYVLIIENSNNFLTEKIFDALISGCIPIYIGPKLSNIGINEDLVKKRKKIS